MVVDLLAPIVSVYPSFAGSTARFIDGHGQNNQILVVDEQWIFRIPRYTGGAACVARTTLILRALRGALPVAIPDPVFISLDGCHSDHVFIGYRLIRGEPLRTDAFERLPDEASRQCVVDQLAGFLKALHAYPIGELLPDDLIAFDPLAQWRNLYARIQSRLYSAMRPDARDAVARHFETFLDDARNRSIQASLIHGDFGTSNILYDPKRGNVVGVIDFDSAGVGDPAVDLAAASCYGLHRFAKDYPEVTAMASRIDFCRGTFALQEALFGAVNGDDAAYRAGMAGYQ